MVGPRTWYVYNTQETLVFPDQSTWETNGEMKRMDDLYKFTQNPNQPIILGAGRMYSKRILDVLVDADCICTSFPPISGRVCQLVSEPVVTV